MINCHYHIFWYSASSFITNILLITMSMKLWKITFFLPYVCVINCSFHIFWSSAFSFIINILLITMSMNLWKITCISALCLCDKLSLPPFSILSLQYYLTNYIYRITLTKVFIFCSLRAVSWYHRHGMLG